MRRLLNQHVVAALLFVFVGALAFGCISAGETGTAGAQDPILSIPRQQPITARIERDTASIVSARKDSVSPVRRVRKLPALSSATDTVKAQVSARAKKGVQRQPNRNSLVGMYTAQVGAFAKTQNALRMQKSAKALYPDRRIVNRYDEKRKLYRVGVGVFASRAEAFAFLRTMKQSHGRRFPDSFVNRIAH